MKFLILYLLMTLAVVFALPTNMEKRGDMKAPKCQPSTLTWRVRNIGSSKPQESFQLVVRSTYIGRSSFATPKVGKTISSGDKRFSVSHGAIANNVPLTLTWQGIQYKFNTYTVGNTQWGNSGDIVGKEYEYWTCLRV
ncbi:MAG: hypothetical protein JOS17DRAFT_736922 [Linnemannia elongata]|nr:MAG: hypothetical protein JOS17DRAFT_736922 [Linnemannia elongata]